MADSLRLAVTAPPVANGESSPVTVVEVLEQVGTSLVGGSGEDLFTIVGTPETEPNADPPEEAYVGLFVPVHIEGEGRMWRRIARENRSIATTFLTLFVEGAGPEDPWTQTTEELAGPDGPWHESGALNDGTPNQVGGRWLLWTETDKVVKGFVTVEDAVGNLVAGVGELTVERRPREYYFKGPTGYFGSIGHLVVQ